MTKKRQIAYEVAKQKEAKMKHLIKEALLRFDADELLQFLHDVTDKKQQEYLEGKMIDILEISRGGQFVPTNSLAEQIKLDDFLASTYDNPYQLQLIA